MEPTTQVTPNPTPVVPVSPVTPAVTSIPVSNPVQEVQYATTGSRILASIIDGVVIAIPTFIISFIIGFITSAVSVNSADTTLATMISFITNLIVYVLTQIYYVYFIGSKGQTVGKMAMKIKVVKEDDNSVPGYGSAFLREVIGKLLSSIVFSLGYFWMIWDVKKQGWHDKIAHTIVVKVQTSDLK